MQYIKINSCSKTIDTETRTQSDQLRSVRLKENLLTTPGENFPACHFFQSKPFTRRVY